MQLFTILYSSRSDVAGTPAEQRAAIDAIVAKAAAANRRHQVSGALLHVRETFIQVLEGPPASVERIFEAICCDTRHSGLKLIEAAPATARAFGEWSMTYLAQDEEPTRLRLNRDLEEIYFSVNVSAVAAIKQMRAVLDRAAAGTDAAAPAKLAQT